MFASQAAYKHKYLLVGALWSTVIDIISEKNPMRYIYKNRHGNRISGLLITSEKVDIESTHDTRTLFFSIKLKRKFVKMVLVLRQNKEILRFKLHNMKGKTWFCYISMNILSNLFKYQQKCMPISWFCDILFTSKRDVNKCCHVFQTCRISRFRIQDWRRNMIIIYVTRLN